MYKNKRLVQNQNILINNNFRRPISQNDNVSNVKFEKKRLNSTRNSKGLSKFKVSTKFQVEIPRCDIDMQRQEETFETHNESTSSLDFHSEYEDLTNDNEIENKVNGIITSLTYTRESLDILSRKILTCLPREFLKKVVQRIIEIEQHYFKLISTDILYDIVKDNGYESMEYNKDIKLYPREPHEIRKKFRKRTNKSLSERKNDRKIKRCENSYNPRLEFYQSEDKNEMTECRETNNLQIEDSKNYYNDPYHSAFSKSQENYNNYNYQTSFNKKNFVDYNYPSMVYKQEEQMQNYNLDNTNRQNSLSEQNLKNFESQKPKLLVSRLDFDKDCDEELNGKSLQFKPLNEPKNDCYEEQIKSTSLVDNRGQNFENLETEQKNFKLVYFTKDKNSFSDSEAKSNDSMSSSTFDNIIKNKRIKDDVNNFKQKYQESSIESLENFETDQKRASPKQQSKQISKLALVSKPKTPTIKITAPKSNKYSKKEQSEPKQKINFTLTPDGKKIFTCECGKDFSTKWSLVRHKRTHTGYRPFQCPFPNCPRTFVQKSARTEHIRSHTGEKPHKCQYCSYKSARSGAIRRHMGYMHKEHLESYLKSKEQKSGQENLEKVNDEKLLSSPSKFSRSSFDNTVHLDSELEAKFSKTKRDSIVVNVGKNGSEKMKTVRSKKFLTDALKEKEFVRELSIIPKPKSRENSGKSVTPSLSNCLQPQDLNYDFSHYDISNSSTTLTNLAQRLTPSIHLNHSTNNLLNYSAVYTKQPETDLQDSISSNLVPRTSPIKDADKKSKSSTNLAFLNNLNLIQSYRPPSQSKIEGNSNSSSEFARVLKDLNENSFSALECHLGNGEGQLQWPSFPK